MRALCSVALVVIWLLPVTAGWAQSAETVSRDTLQNLARSAVFLRADRVFKIEEFPSSGSGFFVHPDGYILTNWHVVADQISGYLWEKEREVSAKVIRLTAVVDSGTPSERELPAKIIARDRKRDLALIKVNYRPPNYVSIMEVDDVRLGDHIWTAGFPFGDLLAQERKANQEDMPNPEVTLVSGTVTSLRRDKDGHLAMVQTDAALNPGSSGSPIVNSRGHLVGVVFAGVTGGQGLGFGVSPNRIRDFVTLQAIRVTIAPRVVLSPPQPIEVTVEPVLVEFGEESGWVELEGDDIETTEFDFQMTDSGMNATVLFPDRIPGRSRPPRYFLSVQLTKKLAGERFKQRYALDAVPESFETLQSARDPSEIMEDRKVLAHEMKIEDYNKSKKVSGQGSGNSLADVAKDMKLKTSESGSVVLDNQTVGEIGATAIDPGRYQLIEDSQLKQALQRFDQVQSEIQAIREQMRGVSYEYRSYLHDRLGELRQTESKLRSSIRRWSVYQCRASKAYFTGGGDRDKYPCSDYSSPF
jgi:hypothetical protein